MLLVIKKQTIPRRNILHRVRAMHTHFSFFFFLIGRNEFHSDQMTTHARSSCCNSVCLCVYERRPYVFPLSFEISYYSEIFISTGKYGAYFTAQNLDLLHYFMFFISVCPSD